jgi:hypothetical protein
MRFHRVFTFDPIAAHVVESVADDRALCGDAGAFATSAAHSAVKKIAECPTCRRIMAVRNFLADLERREP